MVTREQWKKYINEKYIKWRDDTRNTLTDFASWLGIPREVVTKWMNYGVLPSLLYFPQLADKFDDLIPFLGSSPKSSKLSWESIPGDIKSKLVPVIIEASKRASEKGIIINSPEGAEIIRSVLEEYGL